MAENTVNAIVLLRVARGLITEQASYEEHGADRTDMEACANDLRPIIHTLERLESFRHGLKRKRAGEPI